MTARHLAAGYLEALPPALRLHENDSRYAQPLAGALEAGWTLEALAQAVWAAYGVAISLPGAKRINNPGAYSLAILTRISAYSPDDYAAFLADQAATQWKQYAEDSAQVTARTGSSSAAPDSQDAWRANMPREQWDGMCGHPEAVRLMLAPNQCRACRFLAGDPAQVPPHPGYVPPRGPGAPREALCPVCYRRDAGCAHRKPRNDSGEATAALLADVRQEAGLGDDPRPTYPAKPRKSRRGAV